MKKILIVIDMQNDFVTGTLGTPEAEKIVKAVKDKILSYDRENVYATRDTHHEDYLETFEGKHLPVKHCIEGTEGWEIIPELKPLILEENVINKPTFGSLKLAEVITEINSKEPVELEVIGICTDICVSSNTLILRANMPSTVITVDSKCCAGVTPEKHADALEIMESCQINVR